MRILILALLITVQAELSFQQELCKVTTETTGKMLPDLPDQFQTHIEHNFKSGINNYTIELDEYYDFTNDRGTVVLYANNKLEYRYFLYNTNEYISVTDQSCIVTPLSDQDVDNPFGLLTINNSLSINSPSYVLKFGYNFNFTTYEGKDEARGINVEKWTSCIYIEEINSTIKATWTWTDPDSWSTVIQNRQFPVEMTVEYALGIGLSTTEKYQYTSYKPYITATPDIFETPKGVYCAGRKATKPVPKVPTHFSYRIEANLISFNQTTAQTEWYDFENQLARFDYTPLGDVDKLTRGKHKISEVHDYKGGLRYIIDTKLEKCLNVTTLDPYSVDANIANSSNYVRIRTALEMFHFDKVDYQYHGSRKVRDIDCDIWIAKRDDWPPQPGLNTTSYWEWSFMSNSWSAINSGEPQYNIPIQLTITKFVMFGPFYISIPTSYNYYDFKSEKPDLFDFNIEQCFGGIGSKHLVMTFKDVDFHLVNDKHEFKYQVLRTIANLTYVLPTRVADVQLDFVNRDLDVVFKLLDRSDIQGNVESPVYQMSLNDAYTLLNCKINNGEFQVRLDNNTYVAQTGSLKDVVSSGDEKSGYSNTSLFGAVVLSAFFGALAGIGGLFSYFKYKDRASNQSPLSMSGLMNR